MMLLTKENRKALAPMRSTDGHDPRTIAVPVKFFTPWSNWTWYAWEAEDIPADETMNGKPDTFFFGFVVGHEKELGTFSLSELSSVRGPFGLAIERDLHWDPKTTVDAVLRKEGMADLADRLCERKAA
jgi:hypothetical protein